MIGEFRSHLADLRMAGFKPIPTGVVRINRFNDLFSDGKMLSVARTMVSPVVEPMKTELKYSGVVLERFLRFVASRLEQEINLTKQGSQK